MKKERNLDKYEQFITKNYRNKLYSKFVHAIDEYKLIQDGDHVCVCISGGKDSMVMAKLFQIFHAHGNVKFDVTYLVMNPGYNELNLNVIKNNLELLKIPAEIEDTNIFEVANAQTKSSCFLCAKMRRGALYNLAKSKGCNKIALGHHYDDVIETTLMSLLNAGSFQTMLPKLVSTNYGGMELIRPMYFIREKDIIGFSKANELTFIQCACKFTDDVSKHEENSQRKATKELIKTLYHTYNRQVEKNLFIATTNVNLDMLLGYKSDDGGDVSFLDNYEMKKATQLERIEKQNKEKEKNEK